MTENKNIPSPCINNCCLNETDICVGCFRSLDEILAWSQASSEQRLAILEQCKQRKENT